MIELPRAALMAGEIAEAAEFFSFGTNDLTQTTLGLSRDDAGKFLGTYVDRGMLASDPFVSVDAEGVGELVGHRLRTGASDAPELKLGICGEHGGDPASVAFFRRRARLRLVLAVPRADCTSGCRPGRPWQGSGQPGVMLRSVYEMQKPGLMPGFLLMRIELRRPAQKG